MNDQESQQLLEAIHRYFADARPDDDRHNAAISRADRERYGWRFLVLAPAVIVDALRSLVTWQTVRFRDDAAADRELEIMGFQLLWCYRSLIKAGGSDGVIALTMALLSLSDEDAVAPSAYTMASLTAEADPTLRWALGGAARILKLEFERRYGTSCKLALAYALLRLGQTEPFRSFAPPYLAGDVPRKTIEQLATSHRPDEQRLLERYVVGSIILDVASEGRAIPPNLGWKRR